MLVTDPESRADVFELGEILKPLEYTRNDKDMSGYIIVDTKEEEEKVPQPPSGFQNRLNNAMGLSPHRAPLKYMNKSPLSRRNHSTDNIHNLHSKSPINSKPDNTDAQLEAKYRLLLLLDISRVLERLLSVFNDIKVLYEQATRISLLALKHLGVVMEELQPQIDLHRQTISQEELKTFRTLKDKHEHYRQANTKRLEHDAYFTHLFETSSAGDTEFLGYIQFWLRLAIRHTMDFIDQNRKNTIEKTYLENIYRGYLHALKYYHLLVFLKGQPKRVPKIPESPIDRFLNDRTAISPDSFRLFEE